MATDKQINYVNRIITKLGTKRVEEYIRHFWNDAEINSLTKEQAQKIITGLGHHTARPIYGVVGRDIPFANKRF